MLELLLAYFSRVCSASPTRMRRHSKQHGGELGVYVLSISAARARSVYVCMFLYVCMYVYLSVTLLYACVDRGARRRGMHVYEALGKYLLASGSQ